MVKFFNRRNVAVAVIVLAAFLGWKYWTGRKPDLKGQKTAIVKRADVTQALVVSGKIKVGRVATVNFLAAGKLGYLRVHEGDSVKRGQTLAGLDVGDAQAAQTAAYYKYLAADANAKEVEDSVKGHDKDETFAQKNDRVAAQTARDIAYDNWLTAQRAVKYAYLVAPFAGIVTKSTLAGVGDTVGIADGVTIVDPASVYFAGEIDESDIAGVSHGQPMTVELDAYPEAKIAGTVSQVAFESTLSSSGATVFEVRVMLPESDLGKYRIGMNGDAIMVVAQAKQALVVPVEAVDEDMVTVVEGEKTRRVQVKTGVSDDISVEVAGEIREGQVVWIDRK